MASSGRDDNSSQFFFTLNRADELSGKHTLFGKVREGERERERQTDETGREIERVQRAGAIHYMLYSYVSGCWFNSLQHDPTQRCSHEQRGPTY